MEGTQSLTRRDTFLIAMYGQMWGNVNRHILVIWQPVAALFSAFAIFALIKTEALPADLGCAVFVLICAWIIAHVIDANYWFARNLLIITNIERQFLAATDTQLIHYYFAEGHKPRMLDHLTVQAWLAVGVFVLVIGWHFCTRVVPGFCSLGTHVEFVRTLPYIVMFGTGWSLMLFHAKQKRTYAKLLNESPGAAVASF